MNERPVDVQSRSVTEPQRDGVVFDDGGDKEDANKEYFKVGKFQGAMWASYPTISAEK